MLTTFWDLEEKDRAALTSEEVDRFLDAELMTKGVLKVMPLVLDEEPEIAEPETTTFYQVGPIAFTSAERAEAFIKLSPVAIETKYLAGGYRSSIYVAAHLDCYVTEKRLVSESEFAARKSELERRAAIRDANAKRGEEHQRANKEQDKVLEGVWEDWHRCRHIADGHRRVVATFNDYVKTAGDRDIAASFLAKVFSTSAIAEAAEWCGVEIPSQVVDGEFQEAEPVKVAPSDDLSF